MPYKHQSINEINSASEIYSAASDAGFYRYIPVALTKPASLEEITRIFRYCIKNGTAVTFRAAGTSLSGQAVTGEILAVLSKEWSHAEYDEVSGNVKCGPMIIGGDVNKMLKKFGRKIGPDPASINACTIGGMIANNSSGMRSGIKMNPYNTLKNLKFMLPYGTWIDTSYENSNIEFKSDSPEIYRGILQIRDEIRSNPKLRQKIKKIYKVKNTIGYSLNAFLDYDSPVDILAHLIVGSEGTLGFIAEAELETFPLLNEKLTGLLFFKNIKSACNAAIPLRSSGAAAIEFMDEESVKTVRSRNSIEMPFPENENYPAILFEFEADSKEKIETFRSSLNKILPEFDLISEPVFADDENERAKLWNVRSGLLASIGAGRIPGSTMIIEDLAFRLNDLGDAVSDLRELFENYGYQAAIYGHGMDGNVHFIISVDLTNPPAIDIYGRFMNELAALVTDKYSGSLKAEHGTGRNMAPFVEKQWGSRAFSIMKKVKKLLDPHDILNRGVLLNDDPQIHLKNIKTYPQIDPAIDECIECGFCETICPSNELTLTPRKRIILQREIHRISDKQLIDEISRSFEYDVKDTCAVDGLCAIKCPVGINTGEFVKNLRSRSSNQVNRRKALEQSNNFKNYQDSAKRSVRLAHIAKAFPGKDITNFFIKRIEDISGKNKHKIIDFLPYPADIPSFRTAEADFVYFPSCTSQIFGKSEKNSGSVMDTMMNLCSKAEIKMRIPDDAEDHCCGMAFSSKGFFEAAENSAKRLIELLWKESKEGKLSVVVDASSCAYTMKNYDRILSGEHLEKFKKIKILDSIEFAAKYLLPNLKLKPIQKPVVLHRNCSAEKMELNGKLESLCRKMCRELIVPESEGCCGFAGDRGMLHPELTESATKRFTKELEKIEFEVGVSSNIPCQIGMSIATGKKYISFLQLIEMAENGNFMPVVESR